MAASRPARSAVVSLVSISKILWRRLGAFAEDSYPGEACGFLIGKSGQIVRVVLALPAKNISGQRPADGVRPQTLRRFRINPVEYLEAERTATRAGLNVVGFFHSHPDHSARPSTSDAGNIFAHWPGMPHVILSVMKGRFAGGDAFIRKSGTSSIVRKKILIK